MFFKSFLFISDVSIQSSVYSAAKTTADSLYIIAIIQQIQKSSSPRLHS
jgi:hypothetical protein